MGWIPLSVIATLFCAGVVLLIKALTAHNLASSVLNFYFFLTTSVLFLALGLARGESFALPRQSFALFGALALVALVYNDFFVKAVAAAPNPAYPQAILAANVIVTALVAVLAFGADFHPWKLFGIVLTAVGVAVICLVK